MTSRTDPSAPPALDAPNVLAGAAAIVGVAGTVEPYGGSFVIRGHASSRGCDIGLGSRLLWVVVDTRWELPERAAIFWAPAGSYERARSLAEDGPWAASGDPGFDSIYLVGGDDAQLCADRLTESGRRALCAEAWIRPGVSWLDLAPPTRRRNVCATSQSHAGVRDPAKQPSAESVAKLVTAALVIASALEEP